MQVQINLYAVLLAGLSSMIIGTIYYADKVFGAPWKKLAKIDSKRFEKDMPRVMPAVFLAALIASSPSSFGTSDAITTLVSSTARIIGTRGSPGCRQPEHRRAPTPGRPVRRTGPRCSHSAARNGRPRSAALQRGGRSR